MINRCLLLVAVFASSVSFTGCATNRLGMTNMFAKNEAITEEGYKQEISLARLSERNGSYPTAKKIYQHILQQEPDNQLALHRMGVIAGREGQYDESVAYLTQAMNAGEPTGEILSDLGYVYYLQDSTEQAKITLEQALAKDPDHKAARSNLAIVYAEMGEYDIALKHFRDVSSEAEALSNLAYIQSQRGDIALAEQNYMRALDIDNKLRPAAEALIQIAQMTGEVRKREDVRPHVVPEAEQQQDMVAQSEQQLDTNIPAASSYVAAEAFQTEPTSGGNPLRSGSRFTQQQSQVQQVQYSGELQATNASPAAPTAPAQTASAPTSGGLKIPTQGMQSSPAIYNISDQPPVTGTEVPASAMTEIGAVQSEPAQAFSQQIFGALHTATTR